MILCVGCAKSNDIDLTTEDIRNEIIRSGWKKENDYFYIDKPVSWECEIPDDDINVKNIRERWQVNFYLYDGSEMSINIAEWTIFDKDINGLWKINRNLKICEKK